MNNGWIKIHRRLQKKGFAGKPNYFAVWIHLLLKANHKGKEFLFNNKIVKVKRGQILTGRKQLSKLTGVVDTTLERILNYFERNEHQIGQQKTNKYRLITIYNYNKYQSVDSKMDNKWTTSGHQADTNKNVKNVKKKEVRKQTSLSQLKKLTMDDDIQIIQIDEDGTPLYEKSKKESPINKTAFYLQRLFIETAKKELGQSPIYNKAGYVLLCRALKKFTEKELELAIKDWFDEPKKDEDLIQITQCLSDNRLNRWKINQ